MGEGEAGVRWHRTIRNRGGTGKGQGEGTGKEQGRDREGTREGLFGLNFVSGAIIGRSGALFKGILNTI